MLYCRLMGFNALFIASLLITQTSCNSSQSSNRFISKTVKSQDATVNPPPSHEVGEDQIGSPFEPNDEEAITINSEEKMVYIPTVSAKENLNVFNKYKPALAGRALACLMCHAKIRSSVITDFGFGDKFFLGGRKSDHAHLDYTSYRENISAFSVWHNSWSGAEINGDLIVPKTQVLTIPLEDARSPQ